MDAMATSTPASPAWYNLADDVDKMLAPVCSTFDALTPRRRVSSSCLERCSGSKWRAHLDLEPAMGLATRWPSTRPSAASRSRRSSRETRLKLRCDGSEFETESDASTRSGPFSRGSVSESDGESRSPLERGLPAARWSSSKWRSHITGAVELERPATEYSERSETFLCLDWDDTLFPSTEVFAQRGVSIHAEDLVEPGLLREMAAWREALKHLLDAALASSEQVVILTSAERPWVSECVTRFAPELEPIFAKGGGISVVYAQEALSPCATTDSSCFGCLAGLRSWLRYVLAEHLEETPEQRRSRCSQGKRVAMAQQTALFYGPGRSWKNVMSIGDDCHEREALLSLALRRPRGEYRAKALTVAPRQGLEDLTLTLRLLATLLPALVRYNGSLDCAMAAERPLEELACALRTPALALLVPPREHGGSSKPFLSDVSTALKGTLDAQGWLF